MDNQYKRWKHLSFAVFTVLIVSLISIGVLAASYDLTTAGSSAVINGAIFIQFDPTESAGTGNFDTFLSIQKSPQEQGYNTNGSFYYNEKSSTDAITLDAIPTTVIGGTTYREFQLDVNESTNTPLISLDTLYLFTAGRDNLTGPVGSPPNIEGETTLIYDMDAGEDNYLKLDYSLNSGSGAADYILLVPESNFATSPCYADPTNCWVYMFNQMGFQGGVYESDFGFEEWGLTTTGSAVFNPAIDIEKTTNGWEDDVEPVEIIEGTNITWAYTVTNTGDVPLSNIEVTDDILGPVCTIPSLDPGESDICYAYGTASLGLYQNIGTAEGDYSGIIVSDDDPSSYLGVPHTAVSVSTIQLSVQPPKSVVIRWKTETEMTTIGFNLYRTMSGGPEILGDSINTEFIQARSPGDISGGSYTYEDSGLSANVGYSYWLEEVLIDGSSELYGPFALTTGLQYLPFLSR